MLIANDKRLVKTLPELATYAEANLGKLKFACGSIGSELYIAGDFFIGEHPRQSRGSPLAG